MDAGVAGDVAADGDEAIFVQELTIALARSDVEAFLDVYDRGISKGVITRERASIIKGVVRDRVENMHGISAAVSHGPDTVPMDARSISTLHSCEVASVASSSSAVPRELASLVEDVRRMLLRGYGPAVAVGSGSKRGVQPRSKGPALTRFELERYFDDDDESASVGQVGSLCSVDEEKAPGFRAETTQEVGQPAPAVDDSTSVGPPRSDGTFTGSTSSRSMTRRRRGRRAGRRAKLKPARGTRAGAQPVPLAESGLSGYALAAASALAARHWAVLQAVREGGCLQTDSTSPGTRGVPRRGDARGPGS